MKINVLITLLALVLAVGCAGTKTASIPDKVDTFDSLIAKLDKVAISQEDGGRAKGIFNEENGYIATIVFFASGDILWEFELLNWLKDGCLELYGHKDGRLYLSFSKITRYVLTEKGWYNFQTGLRSGFIPDSERKGYTDAMMDTLKALVDSPLSGLDTNAATRRFIEEKLKQEEGNDETPRPEPKGSERLGSVA